MACLADASPPIALGALDGRYRPVVAPLGDHLSEAALNRERVRGEIGWLIHLTTAQVRLSRRTGDFLGLERPQVFDELSLCPSLRMGVSSGGG